MRAFVLILACLGCPGLMQKVYSLSQQNQDSRSATDANLLSTWNKQKQNRVQVKRIVSKVTQSCRPGSASGTLHSVTALAFLFLAHHSTPAFVLTHPGRMMGEKRKALAHAQQMRPSKDQNRIFAHLLTGTHASEHKQRWSRRGHVNMGRLQALGDLFQSYVALETFKLQEAIDKVEGIIPEMPIDKLSKRKSLRGQILKCALLQRAIVNQMMGNMDETIADYRKVLDYLPTDIRAKSGLGMILFQDCDNSSQALEVYSSALEDPPETRFFTFFSVSKKVSSFPFLELPWSSSGLFQRYIAAKEAAAVAAALGEHVKAQEYIDMCYQWDTKNKMEREPLGVELYFIDMLNALAAGNEERAAKRKEDLMRVTPNTDAEGIMRSWEYISSLPVAKPVKPSFFYGTRGMLEFAMDAASLPDGLILEFGTWYGRSLRWIASHFPDAQVHGFDTFTGLPEDWNKYAPQGLYSALGNETAVSSRLPQNVQLHAGCFNETLPGFLKDHAGPIRFMNVDCDLYSSTKDIFDQVSSRIVPGTIIVFDELFFLAKWEEWEFKAWEEAVAENHWTFEYLAINFVNKQAVVRIT